MRPAYYAAPRMTDRLERLLNLVIALRETRRPMTAAEVRRRVAGFGFSDAEAFRRMFERDKADLRDLGVPIETAPLDRWDDRVGYRIDPRRYDLPEVRLEPDELAALAVALQATGLLDEAAAGLLKLEVDAGEPGASAEGPGARLGIVLDAPHRDTLLTAQLSRTRVVFRYRPLGRDASERTVDPHALVHRRGRWYLVGHDRDRDGRRAYRLDRIEGNVRTVGEAGAFPAPTGSVGVDDVVPVPSGDVLPSAEVLAAPAVAWQVARRARGGGSEARDGWTRFTVSVGDPDDFAFWALEFGPDLEVVSPPPLREAVIQRLRPLAAPGTA